MSSSSKWQVLEDMLDKPKDNNIFWKYLGKPVCYILGVSIFIVVLYLYLVPFTNVMGMALFADYKCPVETGVWQVCGRIFDSNHFDPNGSDVGVGFLVFLLIQGTIGFFVLASILAIYSRRKGYVKRFVCIDFCNSCCQNLNDNWHQVTNDQTYECFGMECYSGPCMYYNSTWLFTFSIILGTMMIGLWAGRELAVQTVSQCKPYANTKIGLYGCVSNVDGSYVGGQDCMNCSGVGFGIIGIPLLIVEFIMVLLYFMIKKCRKMFKDERDRLEVEKKKRVAENYEIPSL